MNGERLGGAHDGIVAKNLCCESRLAGHWSLPHHPLIM